MYFLCTGVTHSLYACIYTNVTHSPHTLLYASVTHGLYTFLHTTSVTHSPNMLFFAQSGVTHSPCTFTISDSNQNIV